MTANQERIEQSIRLLTQAQAGLATIDFTPTRSAADMFLPTLAANVDNDKLSDADFRIFVRNSLRGLVFPPDRQVVMTNRGEAYRSGNLWFKWHGSVGSKVAIKDKASITDWHFVEGLPVAP